LWLGSLEISDDLGAVRRIKQAREPHRIAGHKGRWLRQESIEILLGLAPRKCGERRRIPESITVGDRTVHDAGEVRRYSMGHAVGQLVTPDAPGRQRLAARNARLGCVGLAA
jgi:hypothetical protein